MEEKTKQLLAERESNAKEIERLEDVDSELTNAMCEIEGHCPRCQNWHYPHC